MCGVIIHRVGVTVQGESVPQLGLALALGVHIVFDFFQRHIVFLVHIPHNCKQYITTVRKVNTKNNFFLFFFVRLCLTRKLLTIKDLGGAAARRAKSLVDNDLQAAGVAG